MPIKGSIQAIFLGIARLTKVDLFGIIYPLNPSRVLAKSSSKDDFFRNRDRAAFMARTFFKDGKWTEKLKGPVIKVCKCGNKYIKTRDRQTVCLRCYSTIK